MLWGRCIVPCHTWVCSGACLQPAATAGEAILGTVAEEAALALSQDVDALCPYSLPAAKQKQHTRPALFLARSREIAAGFLLERDVARSQKSRYWASEWAMREHPDMCRTIVERELFLKNVRRWAKKTMQGAYGLVAGLVRSGDSAFGYPQAALSQSGCLGAQGSCNAMLAPSKRRRLRGGGGPGHMKVPCIGEELFAWFVDTLNNIKGRLPSCLLLHRAELVAKDLLGIHQLRIEAGDVPPHAKLNLPVISYAWLRRWRRVYGVSARQCNLRYKAPRNVIVRRLRVFWCNVIRLRALHALLEPGGELVFEGFDQKPLWFTASSQEKHWHSAGLEKSLSRRTFP